MTYRSEAIRIKSFIASDEFKPATILVAAALLPSIHKYFFWLKPGAVNSRLFGISADSAWMFVAMFLLLGVIPALTVRFVFHEKLSAYGVEIGDWRRGLQMVAILFPLIALLLLYPSAFNPEMHRAFPYDKSAGDSLVAFVRFELMRGGLFYIAWEFFFRGFVLFGLRRHVGDALAICIQTIPSCLWHIGGPGGELFSSIAGGILFGIMALRTRSIVWPLSLHYLIGVTTDLLMVIIPGRVI